MTSGLLKGNSGHSSKSLMVGNKTPALMTSRYGRFPYALDVVVAINQPKSLTHQNRSLNIGHRERALSWKAKFFIVFTSQRDEPCRMGKAGLFKPCVALTDCSQGFDGIGGLF